MTQLFWLARYCRWIFVFGPTYFDQYEIGMKIRAEVAKEMKKCQDDFIASCEQRNHPRAYLIPPVVGEKRGQWLSNTP